MPPCPSTCSTRYLSSRISPSATDDVSIRNDLLPWSLLARPREGPMIETRRMEPRVAYQRGSIDVTRGVIVEPWRRPKVGAKARFFTALSGEPPRLPPRSGAQKDLRA